MLNALLANAPARENFRSSEFRRDPNLQLPDVLPT